MWRLKKIFFFGVSVLLLLFATRQTGFACEKNNATTAINKTKKSCCTADSKCKMACCTGKIKKTTHCEKHNSKTENKKSKSCDEGCGDTGCSCCPSVFSFAAIVSATLSLELINTSSFLPSKTVSHYRQDMPTSVFLSIWLPPKLSC